jgi:hypothetical protein
VWRWRVESEPQFAAVETLRAQAEGAALARHLETQVGPKWWSSPQAGELLRAYWRSDALPEAVHADAVSGESLLAQLGTPQQGGVGVSLEAAPPPNVTAASTPARDAGTTQPSAAPVSPSNDARAAVPAASADAGARGPQ